MQDERDVVLRIKGIDKSFGPTHAVNNVSLDFYRGEVRGLIGENGSGKSTLTSMIAGFQQPDSGEMEKDGKLYRPATMLDGKQNGICILVQEMGTINGLTVAANLFLGNEGQFATAGVVSQRRMQAAAKEALERVGITDIDPAAMVDTVSFEDRKLIEVAAAMNSNPDIIIFDETTTALSQKGRDKVYEIMRSMRKANRTVIFISHDLQELESICDNISVLRDGALIKTLENKDVSVEAMRSYMIGRELSGHYYREDETANYGDEVVLKAEHISWGGVLHDVSFELHRGEILGFGGLSECGMHELCKVAYGLIQPDEGRVTLVRDNIEIKNPETAAAHGMAFIPKNREQEAIMVSSSVRDNILLTSYDKVKSGPFIWGKQEKRLEHQARERRFAGVQPLRRQQAEGRARQVAGKRLQPFHFRLPDAWHRHWRQGFDLCADGGAEGKGLRHDYGFRGNARASGYVGPGADPAGRKGHGRIEPRSGVHGGKHHPDDDLTRRDRL